MRFTVRKRRQPPAIIIVSLIDILIVLLIFLMVTTTFKQQPALRLTLPESKLAKPGAAEGHVIVTVAKDPPYVFLGQRPVTLDKLKQELKAQAAQNAQLSLSIRPDTEAPFGQILKVMEAAKDAGLEKVNVLAKQPGQP